MKIRKVVEIITDLYIPDWIDLQVYTIFVVEPHQADGFTAAQSLIETNVLIPIVFAAVTPVLIISDLIDTRKQLPVYCMDWA